jgi:periplasmic divalent cation tolerance protein
MTEEIVILITVASPDEGAKIAQALVDEHLAACVNIIPGVRSFFFWEGKTQEAAEALLLCKTTMLRRESVITRVKSLHSYTVPEIIALPIAAGLPAYLDWIRTSVR